MNHIRNVIYTEIERDHTYEEVWQLQKHLQQSIIRRKRAGDETTPGYLLLCEHSPVYTIGKSGKIDHLISSEQEREEAGVEFFKINRGGDITYHGPGQITGYPILDLDQYYNDVHRYVRELEEVIILTLAEYGVKGERVDGYTGVWIVDDKGRRKVCAIGVHMSRWVSLHGFALNVATDLSFFKGIVPCGITEDDTDVTSLSKELERQVDPKETRMVVKRKFAEVFGCNYV